MSDIEWDVRVGEQIEYFDPTLSYELTGYRPITDKQGLDFDPSWFQKAAKAKIETGRYCPYRERSKPYRDFWTEEYKKCKYGVTINGYTITGHHYFFLNYYKLPTAKGVQRGGGGRSVTFPDFYVTQYIFFHYFELAQRLFKDVCLLKARGVGFSEISSAILINTYSVIQNSRSIVVTYAEKQLKSTMKKINQGLDYLNRETEGGFLKLRQAKNTEYYKRASVINKDTRAENGWMSEIEGIVADDPNKVRGDRCDLEFFEEAGSNKVLEKSVIQGEALVSVNAQRIGIRFLGGTGGDSGPQLEGLSKIFNNPVQYKILPVKHNMVQSGETVYTGLFIPAYLSVAPLMDKRGYCNPKDGMEYYQKERSTFTDANSLLIYCAEYCFTPEEALSLEGENEFNRAGLAEQKSRITISKTGKNVILGNLEYEMDKDQAPGFDAIKKVKFIPSQKGKIKIVEHPRRDDHGHVIKNLYVAGIDSIDIGMEDTSAATRDPSQFCIVVKRRAYGLEPPEYVAMYMDRPNNINEAYRAALRLLQYYECKAVLEATKVSLLNFFRNRRLANTYLMKRPQATMNNSRYRNQYTFGSPATEDIIKHQLKLITDFTYDHPDGIWFPEMLDQLLTYSYSEKTKFDIIAAMGMCELGDEELSLFSAPATKTAEEKWQDIGWYIDPDTGEKKYGVIKSSKFDIQVADPFGYGTAVRY